MSQLDDIMELKQEVSAISAVVGRMDITIEKLTEVSSNVSKILAVQTEKVEQSFRVQDKIIESIEKRKEENDRRWELAYVKMDQEKDKISEEIEKLRSEQAKQHEKINSKISKIEKMMWLYMGGFTVVMFILTNFPNALKIIFK